MWGKRRLITVAIVVAVIAVIGYKYQSGSEDKTNIFVPAEINNITVAVSTTGEIEAKNSVEINAPVLEMKRAYIWETTIDQIVDEGTIVKAGQFVAQLSITEIGDKIKSNLDENKKIETQIMQAEIDTALTLRQARDNIINLKYSVEEAEIKLEQSAYEPPATIKQAKMDVEKSARTYRQETENYKLQVSQAEAKLSEIQMNQKQVTDKLEMLNKVQGSFRIIAPEDGMVIYAKDRSGSKQKVGARISMWGKTVATLPDLSILVSRTYINEVDIRKIQKGQKVTLGLDAFPDKDLTGTVSSLANVGEQKPNSDAKVFEVLIEINENDSLFRPGMTTSNTIITNSISDVLSVPLEALNSQGDSITFVYKKSGFSATKQEVEVGVLNDNIAEIKSGLIEGDMVSLSPIESVKDSEVKRL